MLLVILLLIGGVVLLYLGKSPKGGLTELAKNAGFSGPDLAIAVAIAYAESGGNPNAVGDQSLAPDKGPSIGLWQINIGSAAHPEYASIDLTDPQTNANAAYEVYRRAGNSFRPWSTFLTGKYTSYTDREVSV